jgi:hypothetical protein
MRFMHVLCLKMHKAGPERRMEGKEAVRRRGTGKP